MINIIIANINNDECNAIDFDKVVLAHKNKLFNIKLKNKNQNKQENMALKLLTGSKYCNNMTWHSIILFMMMS